MAKDADKVFELVRSLHEQRAMDQVGSVSILLDQNGTVVFYNKPAQTLLNEEDGLAISQDGNLVAQDTRSAERLSSAIRDCLSTARCSEDGNAGFLQVSRPSGRPPYLVFLWPSLADDGGLEHGPGVLVVVNDSEQSEHSIQHLLTNLYQLTPSEAQVAMHLLEGQSAKEIAEARQVSITTVRTQIRNLLMKTDTQRQSEFIALVFRCLSLMVR